MARRRSALLYRPGRNAWAEGLDVGDGVFGTGVRVAAVFRVETDKVIAFAKDPHAQTTYRLPATS